MALTLQVLPFRYISGNRSPCFVQVTCMGFFNLIIIYLPTFRFCSLKKQRLSWHFIVLYMFSSLLEPPPGLPEFWALPPFSPSSLQVSACSQFHMEHWNVFHPLQIYSWSGQLQLSQCVSRLAKILGYWKTGKCLFTVPATTQKENRASS